MIFHPFYSGCVAHFCCSSVKATQTEFDFSRFTSVYTSKHNRDWDRYKLKLQHRMRMRIDGMYEMLNETHGGNFKFLNSRSSHQISCLGCFTGFTENNKFSVKIYFHLVSLPWKLSFWPVDPLVQTATVQLSTFLSRVNAKGFSLERKIKEE